jgi:SAM-dependent methyltransferase
MERVSFAVPGDAYDRFVGRYSRQLAPRFLDFAGVDRGPVLEVGCGPGALTAVLAARFGAAAVAACTFAADGFALVGTFWRAALRLDPAAPDDAHLPFRTEESLLVLFQGAGLRDVTLGTIDLEAHYQDFDDCWDPLAVGIGPTGAYLLRQAPARRDQLREGCRDLLGRPTGPFTLPATAIAVRGIR